MDDSARNQQAPTAAPEASTCRWPVGCARAPAPRQAARGPAPIYGEQADGPGQPVHNALNAWRAKSTGGQPPTSTGEDRAPVATAARTAGQALDRAEQLTAALRETAELVAEAIRTTGDPDAA